MPKQKLNDRIIKQIKETFDDNLTKGLRCNYALTATALKFNVSKSTIFRVIHMGVR